MKTYAMGYTLEVPLPLSTHNMFLWRNRRIIYVIILISGAKIQASTYNLPPKRDITAATRYKLDLLTALQSPGQRPSIRTMMVNNCSPPAVIIRATQDLCKPEIKTFKRLLSLSAVGLNRGISAYTGTLI